MHISTLLGVKGAEVQIHWNPSVWEFVKEGTGNVTIVYHLTSYVTLEHYEDMNQDISEDSDQTSPRKENINNNKVRRSFKFCISESNVDSKAFILLTFTTSSCRRHYSHPISKLLVFKTV